MKKHILAAVALVVTAVPAANAATGTMPFSANIGAVCNIAIDSAGIMVPNAALTELSSQETGGSPGLATITATSAAFSVSAAAPSTFTTAPTGGDTDVTFASLYNASGATTLVDVDGSTASPLDAGTTNLSVDLTATKTSGTFPDGAYEAEITVTCE